MKVKFYLSIGVGEGQEEIEIVEYLFGSSSKDININGVEVGSYGCRNFEGNIVQYGTGLALPRITQAVNCLLK